jgi:hypothetical protein
LRSAVIDALIVLTMPLVDESSVLDIRFEAPSAHWAAAFLQLPLEAVQSDVTRRAAQMASAGVAHTAPVTLADLDRPAAVLTRTQWAIASRVDGTLSPRDLARQSGLSLYETVTSLGALIRRGLCAPVTLGSPAAARPASGATVASVPPAAVPATPLPPDAVSRLITRAAPPAARRPAAATLAVGSPDSSDPAPGPPALPARPATRYSGPLTPQAPAQPVPDHSDPLTRPAAPAQPAAASVPPVRSAPDEASLTRQSEASPARQPEAFPTRQPDGVTSADPAVPAARASWTDAATPVGRTPWPTSATSATSASPDTPVSRASWTGGAASAARDGNGPPPERRSFTPAATPTPLTPPRPPAASVPYGATPQAPVPAVNPAPVDVPSGTPGRPDLPSYPDYRRPTRRPWPQSEAPIPPATLAAPDAQPPAPTWGEPPASYPTRVPQSSRPARGAHRADRGPRPEAPRRPDDEASGAEAPEPPASLPTRRQPFNLPQRQPGRISTGDRYTTNAARSYTAAQASPAQAEDWARPTSFGRPAEADYPSDHPSAPLPITPAAPSQSGGGSESEDFTPAAPDLLRRVLDGLRRLA